MVRCVVPTIFVILPRLIYKPLQVFKLSICILLLSPIPFLKYGAGDSVEDSVKFVTYCITNFSQHGCYETSCNKCWSW